MRKLRMAVGTVVLSGALTLTAAPAYASPEPEREVPQSVVKELPEPLQTAVRENMGDVGWDDGGPYIVWGSMPCRIHLLRPWEWSWAFGTGPCWF